MVNRLRPVSVGAHVELYPVDAWKRIPREASMDALWSIVGPQVDKHMRNLPLWKVFCAVYYEGLAHGVAGGKALAEKELHP